MLYPNPDLKNRIALVTGASRGIGYALSKQLAACGATVIAVSRTVGGLEELDDEIKQTKGQAVLVPLDLKDGDAIDRLGAVIHERWGKLDILIINGAVLGTLTPIAQMRLKDFDEVIDVNVKSTWRLIRSMDPLLRQSDAGRALIMSSGATHSAKAYWSAYAASKAAAEALARSWANETKKLPLCVNSVNPGGTATRMRAKAMPGEDQSTLPSADEVAEKIVPIVSAQCLETGKIFDVKEGTFKTYQIPE